ncbi:MAG: ATP-binding protein [Candidatus Krumholzibacteria bacterium]|nr:ATP-binding protein [Candidatus Krumholzibacteria bacterium]
MDTLYMQPASMNAPTTYLALGGVLAVLVFLTLWREMATTSTGMFFPRSFAALSFVVSRVLVVIFTAALVERHAPPPLFYITLNFMCLYLAAVSMPSYLGQASAGASDDARPVRALSPLREELDSQEIRSLNFQAAVFGIAGAVVYLIVPAAGGFDFTLGGFAGAVLLAATIRVNLFLFTQARRAVPELRQTLVALVASLTASWLLVIAASAFVGGLSMLLLQLSRGADIFALITALFSLQSTYVIQGFHNKNLAHWKHEEAEKAKAELDVLNRVTSELYEDSSAVIQRQQGQFRGLMTRVESLEKILHIGVEIQRYKNLAELLQKVALLVNEQMGFTTVIVRILNDRTQSFETKAYVGPSVDAQEAVMNHRVPRSEYERMLESRFRIGHSYFLRNAASARADARDGAAATGDGVLVSDHWSDVDRLIIPFVDDEDGESATIGYMSVEEPKSKDLSLIEAIDHLEMIAKLSVMAIRHARYYKEVAEKNKKLRMFAEKLAGINKMKSNFVATISHEFRTPLTSIKAYCETLLKNADNVDRTILKEFLVVIDEESDRLMALIEDILDFSQMESGAIKFERTPCTLNDAVRAAVSELARNFDRKRISVHVNIPDAPVMVRAEHELMHQLLVNLLHNASKFAPESGNVRVQLTDETAAARVAVEDDGVGIPEAEVEHIFDHFYQADSTITRRHGGTGIGLAICKNIVDWHDGKIWVENAPGRGARFVVVIPKKQVVVRSHVTELGGALRRYEVERYLELIVELVSDMVGARKASIMLLDQETRELRVECAIGLDEEIVEHARVKLGEGIAGRVARDGRAFLVENIDNDARVDMSNNPYLYDSKSFVSVPVARSGRVVGVINVADPSTKTMFDARDSKLLELFAERVSLILDKLDNFARSSVEFEDVRLALKSVLDTKRYIADQSASAITAVLEDVAEALGLSADEAAVLRYVFNVYDLGLARIGYNIVKRPKALSPEDREHVELHTVMGTDMLKPMENATTVRDAVLCHHENFDGSGYPGRLSGEEIPLHARIIRVADTFRALISHRPYQRQYSVEEALEVIKHRAGMFFDPRVVEAFVSAVENRAQQFAGEHTRRRAGKSAVDNTTTSPA